MYEKLLNEYPTTFQCTCSQIAIQYGSFVTLAPQYHSVCSSVFATGKSIVFTRLPFYAGVGYHVTLRSYFNTLATLCLMAKSTVYDAWHIYNQSVLITSTVLLPGELLTRTHIVFDQFKSTTEITFTRAIAIVQAHARMMLTTIQLNAGLEPWSIISGKRAEFKTVPTIIDNCSCGLDAECQTLLTFFRNYMLPPRESMPNIFRACSAVQSTFQSTLECLFNESCLIVTKPYDMCPELFKTYVLQYTNTTSFLPSRPISYIVDRLLVEDWNEEIHYDQYYSQCAPKSCSYSFVASNSAIYIVTNIVGLFGGLNIALRMLVPFAVDVIRNQTLKRQNPSRSGTWCK